MPRNVEENVYVTIGFARDSPSWQRLQREARYLDISVPHLIKVLLADRAAALEGHGKHLWFPRGTQVRQQQLANPSSSSTAAQAGEGGVSEREAAAVAAAHYWND